MLFVELFLRSTAAIIALLAASLLIFHNSKTTSFRWIALFLISLALGAIIHTAHGIAPPLLVRALILPVSSSFIVLLWIAARSYFIDDFKIGCLELIVIIIWFSLLSFDYLSLASNSPEAGTLAGSIRHFLSYIIVGHIAFVVVSGAGPDLIEARRKVRVYFTLSVIFLYLMNKIAESVYGYHQLPLWFTALLWGLISILLLRSLLPLLQINPKALEIHFGTNNVRKSPPSIPHEQQHIIDNLNSLMTNNEIYLEPELSVRQLAEELDTTEHQLRTLINQAMGHRNFRAYINGYRVRHASILLSSSEQKYSMLDIAMNSGFGSLASFNRIFKETTTQSPREFRSSLKNTLSDPK